MSANNVADAVRALLVGDSGVAALVGERVYIDEAPDKAGLPLIVYGARLQETSDGSAPMCYPVGEYRIGQRDVLLGEIVLPAPLPVVFVWIGGDQFELWKHTQLILDVVPGRGAGFSLEAPEGVRFLSRSRVFSDEENAVLAASPPLTGAKVNGA